MFKWQKFSQTHVEVPHYEHILEFIHLRAQVSETSVTEGRKDASNLSNHRSRGRQPRIHSFISSHIPEREHCQLCQNEKHQLYACPRSLPHDDKIFTVRSQNNCLNCLRVWHYAKQCKSSNHCCLCQKSHHTLLHVDKSERQSSLFSHPNLVNPHPSAVNAKVSSNTVSLGVPSTILLMTCHVSVCDTHGLTTDCRALLDSASLASFISEWLA